MLYQFQSHQIPWSNYNDMNLTKLMSLNKYNELNNTPSIQKYKVCLPFWSLSLPIKYQTLLVFSDLSYFRRACIKYIVKQIGALVS